MGHDDMAMVDPPYWTEEVWRLAQRHANTQASIQKSEELTNLQSRLDKCFTEHKSLLQALVKDLHLIREECRAHRQCDCGALPSRDCPLNPLRNTWDTIVGQAIDSTLS